VGTQGQFATLSDSTVEGGSGLVLVLDTILDDDHTVCLVLDVMGNGEHSLWHLTLCNLPNHLHVCLLLYNVVILSDGEINVQRSTVHNNSLVLSLYLILIVMLSLRAVLTTVCCST
jgi:hypothetical protein